MTEFEEEFASALATAEYFGDDENMLINSGLVIQCAELIEQQAKQIKTLQSKLLDARLAGDRSRIDPQLLTGAK